MISDADHPNFRSPPKPISKLNPEAAEFQCSFTQTSDPVYPTSTPSGITKPLTSSSERFNPYRLSVPDPQIHGEGPFVAALPARDRSSPSSIPQLDQVPMWNSDATKVGGLYNTDSVFVKQRKDGSISLIYEQQLRQRGVHGYSFTILDGAISASDGVGFVFADRVPCSKNIKRLWSVFVNRTGSIVKRMGPNLVRSAHPLLPPLAADQVLSMVLDLDQYKAVFQVTHPSLGTDTVMARSQIDLSDIAELVDCSRGYLCAAVTRAGMVIRLGRAPAALLSMPPVELSPDFNFSHSPSIAFSRQSKIPKSSNYRRTWGSSRNDIPWDMPDMVYPPTAEILEGVYMPLPLQHAVPFYSTKDSEDSPQTVSVQYPTSARKCLDVSSSGDVQSSSSSLYPEASLQKEWSLGRTSNECLQKSRLMPLGNDNSSQYRSSKDSRNPSLDDTPHRNDANRLHTTTLDDASDLAWKSMLNASVISSSLSPNYLGDPAILSIENRGLSTSSNSSMFVGTNRQTTIQEAAELLKSLEQWKDAPTDLSRRTSNDKYPGVEICRTATTSKQSNNTNNSRIAITNKRKLENNDDLDYVEELDFILPEDDERPLELQGNRTVSAPPGGFF